jgi:hypothetical protein
VSILKQADSAVSGRVFFDHPDTCLNGSGLGLLRSKTLSSWVQRLALARTKYLETLELDVHLLDSQSGASGVLTSFGDGRPSDRAAL